MKIGIARNRNIYKSSDDAGTENENYFEVLEFTFPEELDGYVKYIEIEAENEEGKLEYVDRIEDNKFALSNGLTKYDNLQMQVVCKKYVENKAVTVFKSNIFNVTVDSSLNIMEDVEEEQKSLLDRIEAELQEVYQGMEEFKTEIVEDANSRFNTNVREKTEAFNENAESKTNAFNSNYDEKLGTFNTNATSKLEQYNSNDTAKTGAYNSNATEKLGTYNENATNKVAEYNSNAESKLTAYNTNATEKMSAYNELVTELHEDLDETQAKVEQYNTNIDTKYTQYNQNAEAKTTAYNQNATTKTSAYNTNAQTKLSEYNTNAQTKFDTYNTNATEKMTAYNDNAEEKIEEYNDNASALMQSVDELEAKHDAEVAELNEKIADLQEEVDMAGDLIPTGEATGSDITINDSARYRFKKFEVGGNTEQESYTGKNQFGGYTRTVNTAGVRFEYLGDGTITIEGTATANAYSITPAQAIEQGKYNTIPAGTYTISKDSADYDVTIFDTNSNTLANINGSNLSSTITLEEETGIIVRLRIASGVTINTIAHIQIEPGSTATNFERYVGGQAAPNPEYNFPIRNVSGNVEVKVENKNLLNPNKFIHAVNGGAVGSTGALTSYFNSFTTWIEMEEGETYSFSGNLSNVNANVIRTFVTNEEVKIGATVTRVSNITPTQNTYTNTDNYKYLVLEFLDVSSYNESYQWQIEKGSTATSYEAHEEQTATFPTKEGQVFHLRDTLEEDGVHQRRNTLVLNGTENWIYRTSEGHNRFDLTFPNTKVGSKNYNPILSSHFTSKYEINNNNIFLMASGNGFSIIFDEYNNVNDFKAWLAQQYANGTPVIVEYELQEEIIVPYTETQQTAYNQIKKLYSYKGTTHISSDNNPSPIFTVTYRKDYTGITDARLEALEQAIVALGGV